MFNLDLQNSPQKKRVWRVARLKFSISLENFNPGGRSWIFFNLPALRVYFLRLHLQFYFWLRCVTWKNSHGNQLFVADADGAVSCRHEGAERQMQNILEKICILSQNQILIKLLIRSFPRWIWTNGTPKGPKIENDSRSPSGIEKFKRDWKFQASHPPNPYFCGGGGGIQEVEIENFKRDWKFQSRLKISSEIEAFQSLGF